MAEMEQAEKLMTWTIVDQHGRKWAASVNKYGYRAKPRPDGRGAIKEPLMAFVSPPTPLGWKPPYPELIPPAEVMRQEPSNPQGMTIDYEAWHGMAVDAATEYANGLRILAQERYPSNPGEAIENPPADLKKLAGRRPVHPDFVLAMMNNNRWALGLPSLKTGALYDTPAWTSEILDTIGSLWAPKRNPEVEASRFADEDDAELTEEDIDWTGTQYDDRFADLEEAADPQAMGGKRVPVKSPTRKRGAATTEA